MSRLRANKITNQAADGAPTVENGLIISGVTTVTTLDLNGDLDVDGHLNADNVSIAGVATATSFVGSGANLTSLPAANLTGTLPAISGANLTSLPAQATISNNADDRVITGGSGVNLNGESNMTYTSNLLKLSTPSSTSTDAELLHLVGGGTSNRGLKISTGRASGASQNHAAAIYDAINSESSGYGSQHRFKIAGTDCFTIGYNGDFGYVGVNDTVPYPDAVGSNTVNTCLELGSPSGTDTASVIKFNGRDGSGNLNKCQMQWAGANNRFDITVNGNQALQIQPNKDVEITDGNLVIGTSGHGISFAADGNASGMDNEVLDDYEEGSWSALPSTGGTFTNCRYVKVGNLCLITGSVSNLPTHSGSTIEIYGLPFNNRNSGVLGQVTYLGALRGYDLGSNAGNSRPPTTIVLENSRIMVGCSYGGGGWDMLQYNELNNNTNAIQFSVMYQTA